MPAFLKSTLAAGFGLALALGAVPAGGGETEKESVTMSLPQAQAMTQAALQQGRPKLAFSLTQGLLQANPRNGQAHYFQALALASLKDLRASRKAAARAYRVADTDLQRYQAAQLAAKISFADERLTMSQLWLRRAVHYAPNDEVRAVSVKAFKTVRVRNPLQFRLRFSASPSDNVNNGSNSPYNIIEGSPLVGRLSPSAQAIKGVVATSDVQASYRVSQSDSHETRLRGRVYAKRVKFNNPVAGISGSDISSTRAEAGVSHMMAGFSDKALWRFDVKGGRTWYGGDPYYDFAHAGVQRVQKIAPRVRLSFGGSIEEQFDKTFPVFDSTVYEAFAGLSLQMKNGGLLGARVQFREIDNNGRNRASEQWTGLLTHTLGKQIGPAKMSFSLGYSTLDYPTYWVVFPVPGGRLDESVFGGVTATFTDWSYMGFVPTLAVRHEKSRSNVSRFDVDQTSVTMGIQSEF